MLPNEHHEDLYQRIMAFFEYHLLTANGNLTHHGESIDTDEDLSPTLENTIVVLWLKTIHPGLPQLVKQRFGPELRNKTVASLKPEISLATSSLLDELKSIEENRVLRAATPFPTRPRSSHPKRTVKSCVLCKTANSTSVAPHFLSKCPFLPEADRRFMGRTRLIPGDDADNFDDPECEFTEDEECALLDTPSARRIAIVQSPYLSCFYNQYPVRVTLDTGATTNLVSQSFATSIDLPIKPASQFACQADGHTPLDVVGEISCTLHRGDSNFCLDALVVRKLDVDVLAGNPFLTVNDVATRPAKRQVIVGGKDIVSYGAATTRNVSIRRAVLLRAPPKQTVIMPRDYLELALPSELPADDTWALEPRLDSPLNAQSDPFTAWPPPQEITAVSNKLRVVNTTGSPIHLRHSEHVCQVRVIMPATPQSPVPSPLTTPVQSHPQDSPFSDRISLDPDGRLPLEMCDKFRDVHHQYDNVFNPDFPKYNGASGDIYAKVNMGKSLPPQRKGRLPSYNKEKLVELQQKFDELEAHGVFAKPDDVNVTVGYLNLSFLVAKPSGGTRLVTSFGEVARYSKPSPSLMPNIDGVLHDIARWKYIIVTDLRQSFYQIPLEHGSMRFCGVVTPFKGVCVYTRSTMGMPGSETCLEELMSRVLGEFIMQGWVAKIADDLYIGGNDPEEALSHWTSVLKALRKNNLGLNASKTVIFPLQTTILGWIWSSGKLRASPHRLAALSQVQPPSTVQGLRSFIGAYKSLSRVLPGYAKLLDPLDQATAGKQSRDNLVWNDSMLLAFEDAQKALNSCKEITMPQPNDTLHIVTDASVKEKGIAATLYILHDGKTSIAGFYSAKLKKHQQGWLPCELEALSIGAAVKHFAPFIIQSKHPVQVLMDSKPCVQAHSKLLWGEFSASARVTSFLSICSRYRVSVSHIAGSKNIPSDYASRHPMSCPESSCQICKFVSEMEESVVYSLSVQDVIDGSSRMPFANRIAWLATQREWPDFRRVHAHLSQGTRPSKRDVKIQDVKRYLQRVTIASDGLLVVVSDAPCRAATECIVVSRSVLHGLVTAVHLRFNHP